MDENMTQDDRVQRYAEALELHSSHAANPEWRRLLRAVMAVADAEQVELRAVLERWREKAQESGAAYANANSKHHAELDRANRLERLADTLAGKAVDLENRARAAEARVTRVREALRN